MTTKYAPGLSGVGTRRRATDWVGKLFKPGWCLYWCLVYVFKVPGVGDYDGDGSADAEDYWKKAKKLGKVVYASAIGKLDDIPPGVLLMWTGGSHDHGHAAFSLGGGRMVSTDLPTYGKVGICDIELPHTRWGHTFVGYVLVDGNGFTLTRPSKHYVTTTAVNMRTGPSTSHTIVRLLPAGETFEGVELVPDRDATSDRMWIHTTYDRYIAADFAREVS